MMRRLIMLLTVAVIMTVVMAASAAPAFAQPTKFKFGPGATVVKAGSFHAVFTPSGNFNCC